MHQKCLIVEIKNEGHSYLRIMFLRDTLMTRVSYSASPIFFLLWQHDCDIDIPILAYFFLKKSEFYFENIYVSLRNSYIASENQYGSQQKNLQHI